MNINQLMKQAQEMQKKMTSLKENMAKAEYEGKSGGGLVKAVLTGELVLKSISIDKSIIVPEEKEVLEDLILAAYNDAKNKADDDSQSQLSSSMGGMGMPSGFKMPF
jgi:hypothetical protein